MNRKILFSLLGLVLLIASACNTSRSLTDGISFKKGDTYTFKQESNTKSMVSVMGQDVENNQKQVYVYENKVENVLPNGDVEMTSTIKGIEYEMESMGTKMSYSSMDESKNENADQLKGIYSAMIGRQFKMVLDSKGQLKSFSGADAMIEDMTTKMKEEGISTDALEMMKNQFNDKEMQQTFGANMSSLLPTTPVKVGDSWNKTTMMKMLGLKFDTKYTLDKVQDGKAYLSIASTGTPIPDAEPMKMMGMEMKYNLTGTQTGNAVVDLKTGFPINSNLNQDFDGTMTMSGGMLPGEMDADMSVKGTVKFVQQ